MDLSFSQRKFPFNRWFHHLLFWAVVIASIILLNRPEENFQIISTRNLVILCLTLPVPVYLHFFLLSRLFDRKKYMTYTILTLLIILIFSIVFRSLFSEEMRGFNPLITYIVNLTLFLVISTGLKFIKSDFSRRIQIQQDSIKRFQTKGNLIKSRLNPQFMETALKHLHRLSLRKSDQVPPLILQLAELLRYSLESPGKAGVALFGELKYITDYVKLEGLFRGHKFTVKAKGDLKRELPPLLLASLVEQTFNWLNEKVVNSRRGHIQLTSKRTHILFSIQIIKQTDTGIVEADLPSIRNQIQQSFPETGELSIKDAPDSWTVSIQLKGNHRN
jgi:hypothetical protein